MLNRVHGGLGITALWLLLGASPASAGDEFEDGFKDELGRIAAHEAVGAGRQILATILLGAPPRVVAAPAPYPVAPPPVAYYPPPPPPMYDRVVYHRHDHYYHPPVAQVYYEPHPGYRRWHKHHHRHHHDDCDD
jgi:hypothetical protein